MRTSRTTARGAFTILGPALLLGMAACDQRTDVNPVTAEHSEFEPLEPYAPERSVLSSVAPKKAETPQVEVPAVPPEGGLERVRLLARGALVQKPARFEAEVAKAEPNRLTLADEYLVGYRLPESHRLAVEPGDRVVVRYTPTTTAGSIEVSLTLYDAAGPGAKGDDEAAKRPADGPIRMQLVQRGGRGPVRIEERGFSVRQSDTERLLQQTNLDRTSEVPVMVVAGEKLFVLERDRPSNFEVDDVIYRITVLKSHHVEQLPSNLSEEGPPYYLEYVLTRVKPS